ncbi:MAG: dihydroxyacetone kinase phosphoryl donor subunit DhaM, partial [Acidimicrobiia bacterium]
MVGLVVVSHSPALAKAAVELALEMVHGEPPPIAVAAGIDGAEFGTDALAVRKAIEEVDSPEGVVVLMDLGSAILSGEFALDLVDPAMRERVRLISAPLVEGLVAAVVQAAGGEPVEAVVREAMAGLYAKQVQLGMEPEAVEQPTNGEEGDTITLRVT